VGMPVEMNGAGHRPQSRIILGDCLAVLPTLAAQSFDLVFTDPPYPCIDRPYGYWTEPQWLAMMMKVVPQIRRVLKLTGSAVFVLQPNSERVGRMRTWLWDFLSWVGREWNVVQDAYWWNPTILPNGGSTTLGMMRSSVKTCVWMGPPDCYRNQDAVLLPESPRMGRHRKLASRREAVEASYASGNSMDAGRASRAVAKRGGTTPFNLIRESAGGPEKQSWNGHPAGTPLALCSWWLRYLCPPGDSILDPFAGTSTTGIAALQQEKSYVGIERMPEYVEISRKRLNAETTAVSAKA
jgi:DNA modification methylase